MRMSAHKERSHCKNDEILETFKNWHCLNKRRFDFNCDVINNSVFHY